MLANLIALTKQLLIQAKRYSPPLIMASVWYMKMKSYQVFCQVFFILFRLKGVYPCFVQFICVLTVG